MRTLSPPPSLTKTDAAGAALREAIEAGRLAPGERLAVKRLVEDLQMSPTPIREALRLLQAEGLAVYKPHHGMVVADYPAEDVAEVSRMRALLEPLAVELAVRRATPDQLAEIRAAHNAHGEAVRAPLRGGREASLNAAWHQAVYRPCDSRLLIDFIARLWSAVPVEAIWRSDRSEESLAQHELIMEAIERGDAEGARELMREHIEYGVSATLARMRGGRR
jgi:DNA-binding GntR family transcriptional regulator